MEEEAILCKKDKMSRDLPTATIDSLWSYCQEGRFTDIRIVCTDGSLQAHRAMISRALPLLKYVDADLILLPDVSVKLLEQELENLYENNHSFCIENIQNELIKKEESAKLDNGVKDEVINVEDYDDLDETFNEEESEVPITPIKNETIKSSTSVKQTSRRGRGRAPVCEVKGVCDICKQKFNATKCLLNHLSKVHNMLLKCKHCPDQFVNYEKLTIHKQEIHKSLLKYQCNKCERGYQIKSAFEEHTLECGINREYYCQKCGNKFTSKKNLYDHNSKVHAEGSFECRECGKYFTNKVYLIRHHKYAHLNSDRCSCHICGKTLANRKLLDRHIKSVHEKLKEYKCQHCEYESGDPSLLKSHIDSAHLGITYECDKCKSTFTSKTGLYNHSRSVHSNVRPYICQECGEAFKRKKVLDIHIDNKHSTGVYPCSKCDKALKSKLSLEYHLKTHDIQSQFPCEICGRRFITRTKLKMHMNTHTGETPYKCPGQGCVRAFHSSDQLSHHKKQCSFPAVSLVTQY
eukprot:GFUD01038590.1.p1 GENE.GFUD01038590.1~~GFUD01038590.1.p1  ORF type:complete len:519 (+),score=84.88 GFUD01038590.1:64-1620(+)